MNQTELKKYTQKDANNKTEIRIAYLDETLMVEDLKTQ
jgi:hypothetical protein